MIHIHRSCYDVSGIIGPMTPKTINNALLMNKVLIGDPTSKFMTHAYQNI